jgi:thiosulfate/3-mercaptopyruvate sulfurtransferase
MSAMGIKNTDFIVIYDTQGLFTAARVWWLFRLFGHERVAIMEGGLPAWEAANLPTLPGEASLLQPEPYSAVFNDALFAAHHDVECAVEAQDVTIFDARSAGRSATGGFKSKEQLRNIFGDSLSVERGIITTCGSGVTACGLALALYHLGITARVYDGSWTEWASQPDANIRVLTP